MMINQEEFITGIDSGSDSCSSSQAFLQGWDMTLARHVPSLEGLKTPLWSQLDASKAW